MSNVPKTAEDDRVLLTVVKWALEGHISERGVTVEAGDAIRSAVRASAGAVEVPAWLPIETAPKDGTHILVSDGVRVSLGGWVTDIDHGADWEGQIGMAGWWSVDLGANGDRPTHWMPLPAAPFAITAKAPEVPAGYALVPTPITEQMHVAAAKVLIRANGLDGTPQRVLDALIAAAPSALTARPAVALTEEECHRICAMVDAQQEATAGDYAVDFVRAVERAHGIPSANERKE